MCSHVALAFSYDSLASALSVARCVEGTVGADEIEREKGSFMKLSFMKIQQLLQEEDDARFAFEEITDYIGESFMELRKVYKAYGAMGGGGSTMSMAEFLMLVRDCKLIDKKFTSQDVDLVFIKTNIEILLTTLLRFDSVQTLVVILLAQFRNAAY